MEYFYYPKDYKSGERDEKAKKKKNSRSPIISETNFFFLGCL